jgi:hypothetical protein
MLSTLSTIIDGEQHNFLIYLHKNEPVINMTGFFNDTRCEQYYSTQRAKI